MENTELILNIVSIIVVIAIGMVGILIQIWLAKNEDRRRIRQEYLRQKQILNSIEAFMLEIELAKFGHLKELGKDKIPSYFIPEIDASFYISRLSPRIHLKKGLLSTITLKQIIIKLENKAKNINRVLELLQNSGLRRDTTITKQYFNELKNNTYYQDLSNLLEVLRIEWNNLEGYIE